MDPWRRGPVAVGFIPIVAAWFSPGEVMGLCGGVVLVDTTGGEFHETTDGEVWPGKIAIKNLIRHLNG